MEITFHRHEPDAMPATYKCYGDISHLRLKIRLEIIKSTVIPLTNIEEEETGLDPQYNEREELEFSWNEKIFSPREFKRYSEEKNCNDPLQREYHSQIHKLIDEGTKTPENRLFSYTSKDDIPPDLHKSIFYEDGMTTYFRDDDSLSTIFHRQLCILPKKSGSNDYALPVKNIVNFYPSDELRKQNRSLFSTYETMYIVADLSDKSSKSDNSNNANAIEHLLVTIKWNKRTCTLTVTPDFTQFNSPGYKIDFDTVGDTRFTYRYWLANVSSLVEDENNYHQIDKLTSELATNNLTLNYQLNFEIPPKNVRHVFVFAELQKIVGFSGDKLFVQYYIQLPDHWFIDNNSILNGISPQCRCGKTNDLALLSYLFEMKFSQKLKKIHSYEDEISLSQVPQLYFEICSLDSWKRFRVEGYAWTSLPRSPGRHRLVVNCWRPAPTGRRDELKRFFIGSQPQILDFTYLSIPGNHRENLLSKYGFETVTSGRLHLELNIVHQKGATKRKSTKASGGLIDRKTSFLINNVNHILESFKRARQRMLMVRDTI